MPVTPTYPGIYIEELPNSAHTITAAATSVAVFIGYTHPFKTKKWGVAVRIFSFSDYEREFGGFFSSDFLTDNVALAVNQFFLNGGSDAYVVGLLASYHDVSANPPTLQGAFLPAAVTLGSIIFTALEPTDANHTVTVTINNLKASDPINPANLDIADFTIIYGSKVETFRKVTINPNARQNYIKNRIGTIDSPVSSLVTVAPLTPLNANPYGTTMTKVNQVALVLAAPLTATWSTYSAADFAPVFQQDSSLDKVPIFNLLLTPGVSANSVSSEALAFCERKQAFFIMDPPREATADGMGTGLLKIEDVMLGATIPKSANGALYFPYLLSSDPITGLPIEIAPSGTVAGIYARTDTNRGVWKAPAGLETTVLNTTGVVDRGRMTDMRQGTVNLIGVNCLRTFPGVGTVVFGARTLVAGNTAYEQWKYVSVRRMALFLEQTLLRNLTWVVFEPNDSPLWVSIRTSIEGFMMSLYNQGAFQGSTPSVAFQVKCDSTTTTQTDIDLGIVNIVVAFAPLKPAEFVIIKIAQLAGQAQA